MNITEITYQTYQGAPAIIKPGMSDLDIIRDYCSQFHWYNIFIFTTLLFFLLCKAYVYKKMRHNDQLRKELQGRYQTLDNIIDTLMIITSVVQLLVIGYQMLGG